MNKIVNYVNGKKHNISEKFIPVYNPSTGEEISKVLLSQKADFEELINSSKQSQISWSNTTPLKRSRILSNYKNFRYQCM